MNPSRLLPATALAALLALNAGPAAAEALSCDDLQSVADALDDVADAYSDAGTIEEGDAVDSALGDLIDDLEVLADAEAEGQLDDAVDSLASAWEDMDGERFGLALDSVIATLDRLHRRDCQ